MKYLKEFFVPAYIRYQVNFPKEILLPKLKELSGKDSSGFFSEVDILFSDNVIKTMLYSPAFRFVPPMLRAEIVIEPEGVTIFKVICKPSFQMIFGVCLFALAGVITVTMSIINLDGPLFLTGLAGCLLPTNLFMWISWTSSMAVRERFYDYLKKAKELILKEEVNNSSNPG